MLFGDVQNNIIFAMITIMMDVRTQAITFATDNIIVKAWTKSIAIKL
jgi:hypothetical protein